jgi:hypothetical protein
MAIETVLVFFGSAGSADDGPRVRLRSGSQRADSPEGRFVSERSLASQAYAVAEEYGTAALAFVDSSDAFCFGGLLL